MKTQSFYFVLFSLLLIVSACKKKDEEPQPYMKFTLNGTTYTYQHASDFGKVCIFSTYCGTFSLGENHYPYIEIGVPADVQAGKTYNSFNQGFTFLFMDENQNIWYNAYGGTMVITITQWDGNGGWIKGTFSGTLPLESNHSEFIELTNGYFEGNIWYITH